MFNQNSFKQADQRLWGPGGYAEYLEFDLLLTRVKLLPFYVSEQNMISDIYLQIRFWSESVSMTLSFFTQPRVIPKKQKTPSLFCEKWGLDIHSISLPGLGIEGPCAENVIHMLKIFSAIIILVYLQYWIFTDKLRIWSK